jgi:hypothetical protein
VNFDKTVNGKMKYELLFVLQEVSVVASSLGFSIGVDNEPARLGSSEFELAR